MAKATLCVIDGCGKILHGRGLCFRHYMQWWKHGVVGGGRPHARPRAPIADQLRFIDYAASYSDDACLIWPYSRDPKGYGFVSEYDRETRKTAKLFVHRRVCEIVHGEPPADKNNAAHHCGRGQFGCVSGKHVRWASCQENTDDMRIHGTAHRGGGFNGGRKLVESEVLLIRALIGKEKQEAIASKFGVSRSMISQIGSKRKWAHV